eukprot:8945691-Pyramimonas_sp.AAC.1
MRACGVQWETRACEPNEWQRGRGRFTAKAHSNLNLRELEDQCAPTAGRLGTESQRKRPRQISPWTVSWGTLKTTLALRLAITGDNMRVICWLKERWRAKYRPCQTAVTTHRNCLDLALGSSSLLPHQAH